MKKLILFCLLFSPTISLADSIKCYSDNKVVYHHQVENVTYTGDIFIFLEKSSNQIVMYSGDCIVKVGF